MMKTDNMLSHLRVSFARHHPSAFLLAAQLLLLLLYALFDGLHSQRALLAAVGGLIVLLVVWVVARSPATTWVAWVLAIPAFVLSLLSAVIVDSTLLVWSSLFEAALYFYATGSLIAYMMRDYRVTVDELFAAGATFTLLAWGFAYLYTACEVWFPGSFVSTIKPERSRTYVELLSLSFTNLTATGLSDIVALTAPGRVLVMLEQFTGVGYVAMVVSRLIGLTTSGINKRQEFTTQDHAD